MYHVPVMLNEVLEGLNINPDGVYVDVTFGGGGHSRAILEKLSSKGRLFGFDQDLDARKNALDDARFTFVRSNFRYLSNFLRYYGVDKVDGILADLGVSSHHFDDENRGFSFRFEGNLDMRMNQRAERTAAQLLNESDEEYLADIFYKYGELSQARKIARSVVRAREQQPIETTQQFLEILKPYFPFERTKKDMAKAFQALRIEVNDEMAALREMLQQTTQVLKPEGRLVVLTYHSLEDRMVKNFMRAGNVDGVQEKDFYGNLVTPFTAIYNKVLTASAEELEQNPRSRSAKLRVVSRKA